jgi:predicted metalloprotease
MRWEDLPESGNVEDRRSEDGGGGFRRGGGFGGLPGGAGGLSIGTVVVLGLVGWALGIDPSVLIGGAEVLSGGDKPRVEQPSGPRQTGTPQDESGRFVSRVLGSTEAAWKDIFSKDGKTYRPPTLVMYRGVTEARCGTAQAAMGPFYCPNDQKVYLDTSFFNEIESRFRGCSGNSCRFAQAYVIAHEVGHHVQNLLGVLPRAETAQRSAGSKAASNHIQVQVELQADCFAGVWAKHENDLLTAQGKPSFIEAGDTLQRQAQGRVVPDSFTHGTSEQRQRWFSSGFRSGQVASCNTFASTQL